MKTTFEPIGRDRAERRGAEARRRQPTGTPALADDQDDESPGPPTPPGAGRLDVRA